MNLTEKWTCLWSQETYQIGKSAYFEGNLYLSSRIECRYFGLGEFVCNSNNLTIIESYIAIKLPRLEITWNWRAPSIMSKRETHSFPVPFSIPISLALHLSWKMTPFFWFSVPPWYRRFLGEVCLLQVNHRVPKGTVRIFHIDIETDLVWIKSYSRLEIAPHEIFKDNYYVTFN